MQLKCHSVTASIEKEAKAIENDGCIVVKCLQRVISTILSLSPFVFGIQQHQQLIHAPLF